MSRLLAFALLLLVFTGLNLSALSAQPPENEAEEFQIPEEEKPFWEAASLFVNAYANEDAEAIGELFTESAEFYDEFGERTEGRAAIVEMFQGVFDADEQAAIDEILIERVRMLTDTVALEEGLVVTRESETGPVYTTRYVALHTLEADGKWRINTLKDYPRESGDRQVQLNQLVWLTGEWINQDSESTVHTECDWSDDGNYLMRKFVVRTHDGREMSGEQRIGWDPHLKKLRSWTFDSEGGFFNGLWTKHEDEWLLTTVGISASGETVTGTARYTIIDAEMITWQYENLIVGDEVRADSEPVTMVRKPPAPKQQAAN